MATLALAVSAHPQLTPVRECASGERGAGQYLDLDRLAEVAAGTFR